jgi:DNA-binding response OmpR family regulator
MRKAESQALIAIISMSQPIQSKLGEYILYVDDESALARAMPRTLSGLGYRCSAFTNPLDALHAFRADPTRYDAVITDFAMPALTGLQLARELCLIRPDVPIALLSGHTEATDAEDLTHIRLRIRKPPRIEELDRTVKTLLGRG